MFVFMDINTILVHFIGQNKTEILRGEIDMTVYKYGLSNTIEAIEEALENALNTKNKSEKARYIGEAYGMVKAIDFIFDDKSDEESEET